MKLYFEYSIELPLEQINDEYKKRIQEKIISEFPVDLEQLFYNYHIGDTSELHEDLIVNFDENKFITIKLVRKVK